MNTNLKPIAPDVWRNDSSPRLLAGKDQNGRIIYPIPDGNAGQVLEIIELSSNGTLWSFTRQNFKPKPPYDGPEEFEPFLLGYVELPNQIIVQAYIVEAVLEDLEIGMAMEMVIVPFDHERSTFAFKPMGAAR